MAVECINERYSIDIIRSSIHARTTLWLLCSINIISLPSSIVTTSMRLSFSRFTTVAKTCERRETKKNYD